MRCCSVLSLCARVKYVYFARRVRVGNTCIPTAVCVRVGDVPSNNRNGFRPLVLHDDDDDGVCVRRKRKGVAASLYAGTHNPLIPDGSIPR